MKVNATAEERIAYEQRGCQGKLSYATFKEADQARKLLRRINGVRTPFTVYLCTVCRRYHFGRTPDKHTGRRRALRHQREAIAEVSDETEQVYGDFGDEYFTSGKRWRSR